MPGAPAWSTVNMLQRCQLSSSPEPAASIQNRSPNVFVTASPRTFASEPDASVNGITNQSLA